MGLGRSRAGCCPGFDQERDSAVRFVPAGLEASFFARIAVCKLLMLPGGASHRTELLWLNRARSQVLQKPQKLGRLLFTDVTTEPALTKFGCDLLPNLTGTTPVELRYEPCQSPIGADCRQHVQSEMIGIKPQRMRLAVKGCTAVLGKRNSELSQSERFAVCAVVAINLDCDGASYGPFNRSDLFDRCAAVQARSQRHRLVARLDDDTATTGCYRSDDDPQTVADTTARRSAPLL